jgi:valyl-tRNA synthetase
MDDMDKTYHPESIEQKWYNTWEAAGHFKAAGDGTPYCIVIPPPNVTGTLHMGHGFQDTIMDTLIRYQRMQGKKTLWQMGTDHAGIATQMVVERQLEREGSDRESLGRDAFEKRVWDWKEHSGGTICKQLRRLGTSVDWERERFTMDEGLSKAVLDVFVRLYREDLIYRGTRLVNWDPHLQSAVSDLEVLNDEADGHLWHITYPLADSDESLTVATTRPETMLGDTAVAVHPDDERYQHLIGKQIRLPLTERTIPVIADEYVDKEFGSGCVKITPAHDFNDYDVGKRHDLPLINIFTKDAHLNDNAPKAYQGLERFAARKQILEDLEKQDLLVKTEKHKHALPRGERSGVVIEPYLTEQWYVKAAPLAAPAIDVVKQGKIRFIPENWDKTYYQWMENIEDWCISRQLWWGHRIPAWYDAEGEIYVGHDEAEVRAHYQLADDVQLTQDEDVLDTWFSSALWPFSTLGWPEKTQDFKDFYPTNVLVTGFDIIFFWVARMIMMGLKFTGEVPFHEVYITGLIRDADGHKMSKSKGNILDPIDLIDGIELDPLIAKRTKNMMQPKLAEKIMKRTQKEFPDGIAAHGTDAVRFTFLSLATPGRNVRFSMERLEGNRNFCNKLWNAARYVLLNTEDFTPGGEAEFSATDLWIRARLQKTVNEAHQHLANYRFDLLTHTLYDFTWHEFCDWYLELSKPMLYGDDVNPAQKAGCQQTLLDVLDTLLRLLHPALPFISEEIWQHIAERKGQEKSSLMVQAYPEAANVAKHQALFDEIDLIKQIIVGVRTIRAEMNIPPSRQVPLSIAKWQAADRQCIENYDLYIKALAKIEKTDWLNANDSAPVAATALAGSLELLIPLAGLIDKDAELSRLDREMTKLDKDRIKTQQKLGNERFIANAPEDVVVKEKEKLTTLESALEKLQHHKARIEALAS